MPGRPAPFARGGPTDLGMTAGAQSGVSAIQKSRLHRRKG
jgi:hypothetical protein